MITHLYLLLGIYSIMCVFLRPSKSLIYKGLFYVFWCSRCI